MADKYSTFAELTASEHENAYRIEVRAVGGSVAIVAPHGGGIEPGTSEVSRAIAGDEFSLYVFEGVKRQGNSDLHITSTRFDEPQCLELLRKTNFAVAVHGEGGDREVVYLGGRNLELGERMRAELEACGFRVEQHPSPRLQGTDPDNICNRCASGMGVQLELSAGLRRTFFDSPSSALGRSRPTEHLARFREAVRTALQLGALACTGL